MRTNAYARPWRWAVTLGLLLTASIPSGAQTLDSLVHLAIEKYPSVEAARIAIRQADARARGALAWEPPKAGLDISMLPPSNPNPFARGETMLMVEQEIPVFGRNRAMARAEGIGADIGRAAVLKEERELRGRVEREYYTLWLLDRRDEVNAKGREHANLLAKTAETRYANNRGTQSEIYTVSIESERLLMERKEIAEERAESLGRLNLLLGRPEGTPAEIPGVLPMPELPPFDSLAPAIDGHPALREMERMAAMSGAEADAQKEMLKPMLMLRGGIGYMPEGHPVREGTIFSMSNESMMGMEPHVDHVALAVGAMISIPLASWSRSGPESAAEVHTLEASRKLLERDAMRADMLAELRSAYSRARRAALRISFYKQTQLPMLDRSLESIVADYTNNRATFSSVIDAYHMPMMAEMDLYMQEMEYAMAFSMITELTGGRP
ncbi:MAG: outer membrane protein-like protein [Chlorobi bacterium]|nr:outer membrane protein-like protein [Chlorobiota bacterium]